MDEIVYRDVAEAELDRALFRDFIRRQVVTKCRWWEDGTWVVRDAPAVDDWTEEDYLFLVDCLKQTVRGGGFVHAAFVGGRLKGFAAVKPALFGGAQRYLELAALHVSADLRRHEIGAALFAAARRWAREHGARQLYLSAHPAVETQAFYRRMGCEDAARRGPAQAGAAPDDCPLVCAV